MPETRTFDPSEGDDLAKLVRDAIGERVRPNEPGAKPAAPADDDELEDDGTASVIDLPDLNF